MAHHFCSQMLKYKTAGRLSSRMVKYKMAPPLFFVVTYVVVVIMVVVMVVRANVTTYESMTQLISETQTETLTTRAKKNLTTRRRACFAPLNAEDI